MMLLPIALASIVLPSVPFMDSQKVTFGNRVSADISRYGAVYIELGEAPNSIWFLSLNEGETQIDRQTDGCVGGIISSNESGDWNYIAAHRSTSRCSVRCEQGYIYTLPRKPHFFPVTFNIIRGLWSSKVRPRPFAGVSLLGYLGCGLLCSANTSSIYFLHPFLLYKMCCSAIAISGSILFVLKGLHSFIILLLTTLVRAQQEEYAHSEHPKQRGFNARN